MQNNQFYAVIVAGGNGNRMQSAIPKQFLPIKGLPILMHTLLKFGLSKYQPNLILVLAEEHISIWENLVIEYKFDLAHTIVKGGNERFYSVKNSLHLIPEHTIVAIHDGVRPLVSEELINASFETALEKNNAVCAIPSKDSVRLAENDLENKMLPRHQVYLVQTPQVFNSSQLKKAYSQEYQSNFTDDASVVQSSGFTINLIAGDSNNIKITLPLDLKIAEILL
jgi:2-C-methyl-D-erythritol 4-phosphate cytidylyltransferase